MTVEFAGATSGPSVTVDRVSMVVGEMLEKRFKAPRTIAPDDSLTDAGVSSLDMVNLMLALEAAFDVFIPAELIKPSSFRSIASVSALIDTLRPVESAAA